MIEKLFKLKENKTTVRIEIAAGVTTFMTMAYIIFVNPGILANVIPLDDPFRETFFGAVMMATCLSAAVATFIMGFYANYPIALAPGMGENAFFAFTVCGAAAWGFSWQQGFLIVFISGILFLILTLVRIREMIINAIPSSLKNAIAAAIGLFIAFIGLKDAGIIVGNPATFVTLGNLRSPPTLLAIFGFLIILFLMLRKIKGAILWGILITAVVGFIASKIMLAFNPQLQPLVTYKGIIGTPPSVAPTAVAFFTKQSWINLLTWNFVAAVIIFLFMDVFDTIGTLIGVGQRAGFIKNGKLPRANRALLADASGTVVGSLLGTSTVTSYIESAAGVEVGGRTGLASVITGLLFIVAIFFNPLVKMIGGGYQVGPGASLYPITAPALIIVGSMMMTLVAKIQWDDYTEAIPSFLIIIGIPLTFSIANGFAFGFISYPILKLFSGRGREVSWLVYLLAVIFILRYAFL